MADKAETLSDVLRRTILDSGKALIAIERETGVQRMSIARFLEGKTSLRLDKADKLAAYFGLKLRPARRKKG
jgi:plasmid maintenance system antidote protein VapI